MKKIKVFITPTTHWDREWVMSFGQFQIRLVNLMDNVLNITDSSPDYCFFIDGQVIALEDYLEIKPEQRVKISSLMRDKRLIAGPWYVLADIFLQNGESTIRNLLIGMSKIRELGGEPLMLGYIPDSFGSTATTPMILNSFGIKYATIGRGRPEWSSKMPHFEFSWEAPDGSKVLAASHGYSSGLFLSYMDIWTDIMQPSSIYPDADVVLERFIEEAARQKEQAATSNLYFPVGVDHMEPRGTLPEILRYINEHQEEYELVFGMPEDYLKAVGAENKALSNYIGEFRGSDENPMDLVGTLSSYMYLKQQNDYSEDLLQRLAEPLWTMVSSLTGVPYPSGHLHKMWKLLLANHPHDSICGCSIEQVHKDMQNRYEQIHDIGIYLIKDGLHHLLSGINNISANPDAIALTVVNPLGRTHSGPVRSLIRVPRRFNHSAYSLRDSGGNIIPSRIVHRKDKNKDLESVYMTNEQLANVISKDANDERPDMQVFTVLEIEFIARDVPELGYKTYWIEPCSENHVISPFICICEKGMENEYIRVSFNDNGTFDLLCKQTGYTYTNLNYFLDREEVGDLYDHHESEEVKEFDSKACIGEWKLYEQEMHRITYKLVLNWELPEEFKDGQRTKTLKRMPVIIYATLFANADRLDVAVELDNVCKDHCLRMAFDTGLNVETVFAYDHFNVIGRKVSTNGGEWRDNPFQQFVDVSDGEKGLCISTRGLPAYEALACNNGTSIQLTLVRSAGSLGNAAGANYPNSGGQCQGLFRFEYALIPHKGNWVEGECLHKSVDYKTPFLVEADLQHEGMLPPSGSLLHINSKAGLEPFVSCLKQAENGDGWVIRLWNSGEADYVGLTSVFNIKSVNITNSNETPIDGIKSIGGDIYMPARGLTTIRFGIGVV